MPRPRLARRLLLTWTLALPIILLAAPALAGDLVVTPGGWATLEGQAYRCALGRSGIKAGKREGDGATPAGTFPLLRVLYRPDKFPQPPASGLPVAAIAPDDGWCDEPSHPAYNRPVKLPFAASHEELWRADNLYDLIAVVGYNDDPVVPGQGSAIFLHVAREGHAPTAGCLAFNREDLLEIVARLRQGDRVVIQGP